MTWEIVQDKKISKKKDKVAKNKVELAEQICFTYLTRKDTLLHAGYSVLR